MGGDWLSSSPVNAFRQKYSAVIHTRIDKTIEKFLFVLS
jgi:hypothetical protein